MDKTDVFSSCFMTILVAVVVLCILAGLAWAFSVGTVCGTVVKEFVDSGNMMYSIQTEKGIETLSNKDNIMQGKFNSGDIPQQISVGKIYCFNINGFRFPLLSMFKNIVTVNPR